jgi:hypothetical protein
LKFKVKAGERSCVAPTSRRAYGPSSGAAGADAGSRREHQYNGSSRTMSASLRLRWEYRPGSELFAVYSGGRNTLSGGYPDLLNRSVALKVSGLLRF